MFAPQMLINQLSLYHLETSVEYGGMKAFKNEAANQKPTKKTKIFLNLSDLFLSKNIVQQIHQVKQSKTENTNH